jgi:hypothetical protein
MKTAKTAKLVSTGFLIVLLISVPMVALLPIVVYGEEKTSSPPPTPLTGQMGANMPPVGQSLVPEGVFAVQLVEALKISRTQDEAQAESMLSAIGIEPKNGWIAGYPVTPPMLVEIEKGVAGAAEAGKLEMGRAQAIKAVGDLKARLGLTVTSEAAPPSATQAAPSGRPSRTVIYKYVDKQGVVHFTDRYETIPGEYRNQVDQIEMKREIVQPTSSGGPAIGGPAIENTEMPANSYLPNPNPEVINNYYYDYGPPAVTYYAPPLPYYYLYSWVPYPFWYSGFFCRGFFILNDFHRHVYVNRRPFAVTNHVVNTATHRVSVVDPANRTLRGGPTSNRPASAQIYHSPSAQKGARQIVGLSQNRMASAGVSRTTRMRNVTASASTRPSQITAPRREGVAGSNAGYPQMSRGRTLSRPAVSGRSFSSASSSASPRFSGAAPSFPRGPSSSTPSYSGTGSFGGYHGSGGSIQGGGVHGGTGRGGRG